MQGKSAFLSILLLLIPGTGYCTKESEAVALDAVYAIVETARVLDWTKSFRPA